MKFLISKIKQLEAKDKQFLLLTLSALIANLFLPLPLVIIVALMQIVIPLMQLRVDRLKWDYDAYARECYSFKEDFDHKRKYPDLLTFEEYKKYKNFKKYWIF